MNNTVVIATSKELTGKELSAVFEHAPWAARREPLQLEQMIRASFVVVTARRNQRLVGFGRAWGDGIYRAVLDDIVVLPDERGSGIGGSVINQLLHECQGIAEVALTCREDVARFYERFGFQRYTGVHMKRPPQ
jgi:GNAT superfamily N-acetyltransferase